MEEPSVDRFVTQLNVSRYRDQLLDEPAPDTRATLMRLLVAEESQLGRDLEHLAATERFVAACDDAIKRHESIVAHHESGGFDPSRARAFLDGLRTCRDLHQRHLSWLIAQEFQRRV